MFACMYIRENTWAAILAAKWSLGVTAEVNLSDSYVRFDKIQNTNVSTLWN